MRLITPLKYAAICLVACQRTINLIWQEYKDGQWTNFERQWQITIRAYLKLKERMAKIEFPEEDLDILINYYIKWDAEGMPDRVRELRYSFGIKPDELPEEPPIAEDNPLFTE